jgi:glutamate/tyrosine decarboxylase-like PLP-dependent enzyme
VEEERAPAARLPGWHDAGMTTPYDDYPQLLTRVTGHALRWLDELPERPNRVATTTAQLLEQLGGPLPDKGEDPAATLDALVAAAEPGLLPSPGPRFFGWVTGGSLPAAMAADLMAVVWDQNAVLRESSPAATVAERVAGSWLCDVLGLPATAAVGFVTGGQMANFTCLAAARHAVLARAGWDVEARGLAGSPGVRVLTGRDRHATADLALRYLGIGTDAIEALDTDEQGRLDVAALRRALAAGAGTPTIVMLAAGNVNTGAFDAVREATTAAHEHGAWVHVDGAFGLWAAAADSTRHLVDGVELADSWAVDGHKWLNTPYDNGFAIVADPEALTGAMTVASPYVVHADDVLDSNRLTPESSRRARGFAVWAALRSLGRSGVADLVERCCGHARAIAVGLRAVPGAEVLNDVVLNQVLVAFDDDATTQAVLAGMRADGTAYLTPSRWRDRAVIRVSVSGWATGDDDVARSLDAFRRVSAQVRGDR